MIAQRSSTSICGAVRRHVADAVGDRVEELADRLLAQVVLDQVGRRHPGVAPLLERVRALGDHAVALADQAVARRAVDAEALACRASIVCFEISNCGGKVRAQTPLALPR